MEIQRSAGVALGLIDQPERVEGVGGVGVLLDHLEGVYGWEDHGGGKV